MADAWARKAVDLGSDSEGEDSGDSEDSSEDSSEETVTTESAAARVAKLLAKPGEDASDEQLAAAQVHSITLITLTSPRTP